jgi:hypothetical protein
MLQNQNPIQKTEELNAERRVLKIHNLTNLPNYTQITYQKCKRKSPQMNWE